MASDYPGALDTLSNPTPTDAMNDGTGHAAQHADANDAIEAIQATLGIDPQGTESTVVDRLDAIEAGGGGGGGGAVLLDSSTFTTASSVTFDGCFDSTCDSWRIVVGLSAVSASNIPAWRLRASAADVSSGVYYQSGFAKGYAGGIVGWEYTAATAGKMIYVATTVTVSMIIDLVRVSSTMFHFTITSYDGNAIWQTGAGRVAAAADGIKFYPASGTFTGHAEVTGFLNT
jgi:hypothetical protein